MTPEKTERNALQRDKLLNLYAAFHDRASDVLEEPGILEGVTIDDHKWLCDKLEEIANEWDILGQLERRPL